MFSWFKKDRLEVYKPKERKIFSYWNGLRMVHADPLVLYKRYAEKRMELASDIRLARSIHKDADKGHTGAMEKIRWVFDLPLPKSGNWIEPEGSLDGVETGELLDHFLNFIETLKKNSSQSVTPLINTEGLNSTSENALPTNNSLDSGSTKNAPITKEPDPSYSGSEWQKEV